MNDVRGTRDFDEEGFHEIQLSGKQLVFLCMATTVVSIVIFLCGVLVGRGVRPVETLAEAATPAPADTPVTEPAPPPPAGLRAVPGKAADSKPAARATPAPASPPAPAPAPKASDDTKGASAKGDAAKAATTMLAPPKSSAAHVVAPATLTPPATPKADALPNAAPPASAPTAAPNVGASASATSGGAIAVQVGALRSKADAEALARRLSGKGYAAYIVAPEAGAANQVFKVRVGNYASQDEAERVKRRLQQEEKLQPWITH